MPTIYFRRHEDGAPRSDGFCVPAGDDACLVVDDRYCVRCGSRLRVVSVRGSYYSDGKIETEDAACVECGQYNGTIERDCNSV